eukprot:gene4461-6909_t
MGSMVRVFSGTPKKKSGDGEWRFEVMEAAMQEKLKHGVKYNMKVLIRGERGAGKSSLLRRLQAKPFDEEYTKTPQIQAATIHWCSEAKDTVTGEAEPIKLEVWDVVDEGFRTKQQQQQEKLGPPGLETPLSDAANIDVYRGAHAVVFVLSADRGTAALDYLKRELLRLPRGVCVLVLRNKCDLPRVTLTEADIVEALSHHASTTSPFLSDLLGGSRKNEQPTFAIKPRVISSSMANCYGLKQLYTYLNIPFEFLRSMQVEDLLKRKWEEIHAFEKDIAAVQESFDDYSEWVERETGGAAVDGSESENCAGPHASPQGRQDQEEYDDMEEAYMRNSGSASGSPARVSVSKEDRGLPSVPVDGLLKLNGRSGSFLNEADDKSKTSSPCTSQVSDAVSGTPATNRKKSLGFSLKERWATRRENKEKEKIAKKIAAAEKEETKRQSALVMKHEPVVVDVHAVQEDAAANFAGMAAIDDSFFDDVSADEAQQKAASALPGGEALTDSSDSDVTAAQLALRSSSKKKKKVPSSKNTVNTITEPPSAAAKQTTGEQTAEDEGEKAGELPGEGGEAGDGDADKAAKRAKREEKRREEKQTREKEKEDRLRAEKQAKEKEREDRQRADALRQLAAEEEEAAKKERELAWQVDVGESFKEAEAAAFFSDDESDHSPAEEHQQSDPSAARIVDSDDNTMFANLPKRSKNPKKLSDHPNKQSPAPDADDPVVSAWRDPVPTWENTTGLAGHHQQQSHQQQPEVSSSALAAVQAAMASLEQDVASLPPQPEAKAKKEKREKKEKKDKKEKENRQEKEPKAERRRRRDDDEEEEGAKTKKEKKHRKRRDEDDPDAADA